MEQQLKHFLITRFNLKNEHWINNNAVSENWLKNRIKIFEKICYPSVINQSNQQFTWLIFFDIDTPNTIKKYIEENYTSDLIQIHYIDGFKELETICKRIISTQISPNSYFITSRLDNDDALHKDYIDTIKNLSIPRSKTVIDIRNGYQLYFENNLGQAKAYFSTFNPFISLISDDKTLELVIDKEHTDWNNKNYTCIAYLKKRLWMQYIHDNNQLNKLITSLPTVYVDIKQFSIQDVSMKAINWKVRILNFISLPILGFFYLKNQLRGILKIF